MLSGIRQGALRTVLMGSLVWALLGGVVQGAPLEKIVYATTATGGLGFLTDVIKRHRIDERHGITLDLKPFSPAEAEKATYYKKVDAGPFPLVSAVRVNAKGDRIRVFAPMLWSHFAILARPGANIRTVEELRGRRLASQERITAGYNTAALAFRMLGWDFEKSVRLVIGSPQVMMAWLQKGEVDSAIIFYPMAARGIAEGWAVELARLSQIWERQTGGPLLTLGHAVHQDWLEARPDTARRLARVFLDGQRYVAAHPETVQESLKFLGAKSDREIDLLKKAMPTFYPTSWDRKGVEDAKLVLKKSMEFGILENVPDKVLEDLFVILE
ncbi:MAG: ABC transporter substrate-binding protein [Deltaproteobacteria bacterium]|nr:ABC transporter substrate-binding protein [Deltaproteobacteria bacterium]MBI3078906.1 ABC transporter substrate-binding protein [Deltaproteobacteria bacterium]